MGRRKRGPTRSGLGPVDLPRIEAAVREILAAIGEDPERDGLLDTPGRVARMYEEVFAGPARVARTTTSRCSSRPTTTRWSWSVTSR